MKSDPLLRPFQLKHLSLRNRVMSTPHEPAYSEDGMPKDRYRLYHVEKARGGIALTMRAGSASAFARSFLQRFGMSPVAARAAMRVPFPAATGRVERGA